MTEPGTPRTEEFDAPPLRRLRYFHGQMLGARDFQREQEYHREKLRLRMRGLLGYGVVCGLHVEPVPRDEDDCPPDDAAEESTRPGESAEEGGTEPERARRRAKVRITPGLAVDCEGNEVVVRGGCVIDLWKALPPHERDTDTVWVGIEYAERPVEPTRAVYNDACADTSDCEFGWTEECYAVRVTGCEPPVDERCDTCCSACEHTVLWLARIDCADWYEPVRRDQIHMNVRRPFGRHLPTVITGINWIHGHTYTIDEAKELLGTQNEDGGLVVRFSADVRSDSLRPGVVELQVIEGGSGRNASTWYMGGTFTEPDPEADECDEFTREFRYRQTTRETLQDGDRVLITVRAAFLLDRCCRPVDGTHVGGRVPVIHTGATLSGDHGGECRDLPPSGIGPWTSGTGAGGDVFESWFFVKER
ncbi:hypothetical protein GCM10017744_011410 [Streptomyces antimycoticus]|uniref:Uncharacterized protein n=1 Tax=Streptomyces antimycoticus TaxID=68175 RepID=A0A4D4KNS1_9ACTN|nr:hypothetical protein [Streptomyces antimycoticus]GDY48047.1 hypothetical protein SANT12839_089290 [Streptomyces antimycoticus]